MAQDIRITLIPLPESEAIGYEANKLQIDKFSFLIFNHSTICIIECALCA